ncbi:hypothetical protein ACWC5G_37520, partial [Streptomyces sp. NPDC001274]
GAKPRLGYFEGGGGPATASPQPVRPASGGPAAARAARPREAGFTEVGRMLREPCEGERFRRGHLLMRRVYGEGNEK